MGQPRGEPPTTTEHLRRPDNGRSAPTRDSLVMVVGHSWSCLVAEVGGRWSPETAEFLWALAKARAQSEPLLPGILDHGRVAVVEEFGKRVPSQSGDVASPADDPNDDDNLSDTVSVDSAEGPEEVAPDTPAEPELVAGLPRNVTLRMALR